jgi:hypothetical protein
VLGLACWYCVLLLFESAWLNGAAAELLGGHSKEVAYPVGLVGLPVSYSNIDTWQASGCARDRLHFLHLEHLYRVVLMRGMPTAAHPDELSTP